MEENLNTFVMKHPPNSPDLNPIEHIWKVLKDKIEKKSPQSKDELEEALKTE